jgi:hypothetical protein
MKETYPVIVTMEGRVGAELNSEILYIKQVRSSCMTTNIVREPVRDCTASLCVVLPVANRKALVSYAEWSPCKWKTGICM